MSSEAKGNGNGKGNATAHQYEGDEGVAPARQQSLLGCSRGMVTALGQLSEINLKANFIALNAAIEGARSQTQHENFTLVADQVRRQASRTAELAEALGDEVRELQTRALKATAVRFADIAADIIDKIDRNLFERNCDCQAWATFADVVACAEALETVKDVRAHFSPSLLGHGDPGAAGAEDDVVCSDEGTAILAACEQLTKLAEVYRVYADIFVVNGVGQICAAARSHRLIGHSQADEKWFSEVMRTGEVFVTDMHWSKELEKYAVAYSAPIKNAKGKVVGVLSTRFDWDFVEDIIGRAPVSKECRLEIINGECVVIANSKKRGILKDSMHWLMAGEAAVENGAGYSIECARNGRLSAYGYCHTVGFGAYPGKGWSAIVCNPVDQIEAQFLLEPIARDGNAQRRASETANAELESVAALIKERVKSINAINNETNMLAINAAIQAGVAGAEGEGFSVIASEIGKLAKQSEDFVKRVNSLTEELGRCVDTTVAMRLGDAAFDTIDKIDRNLFERYCDMQAFAHFKQVVSAVGLKRGDADLNELLRRVHAIYEVYLDIFVLDLEGNILSAAVRKELVGQCQSDREWFREAVRGQLVVTDLYHSKTVGEPTMAFASPVRNSNGQVVGVITTRMNCQVIFDIIRATIVGQDSRVYLINAKGTVIGSSEGDGMFEQSFSHLRAFRALETQGAGFMYDTDPKTGTQYAVGYAKTPGYNTYKGKGWGVFILRPLERN